MKSNGQSLDNAERIFFENIQLLLKKAMVSMRRLNKEELHTICGVDAAYSTKNHVVAVATLLNSKTGELLEQSEYEGSVTFPYAPGLFFLREGPFACQAITKLKVRPSLVCFDAHGRAHPRHLGLATICGMVLGIRSIGIAKSKFVGQSRSYKLGTKKRVRGKKDVLGFVMEDRSNKKTYWSPGFSLSMSELESLMTDYGDICLKSIAESHLRTKKVLQNQSNH